jgi:hypothetical protein
MGRWGDGEMGRWGGRINTNYQLPITNYQLPIPNAQCPIPNSQSPIPYAQFFIQATILSKINRIY